MSLELEEEEEVLEPGTVTEEKPDAAAAPVRSDDTAAALKELAGELRSSREAQKPKDEPTAIDPAVLKKEWAFWEPDGAFIRKFFKANPDATDEDLKDQVEAMQQMHQGIMRQSYTGMQKLLAQALEKFEKERISPLQEFYSKANTEKARNSFNESFPVFKDKRYDKILGLAQKSLEGRKDLSDDETFFKAVAETAAELIRDVNPDFVLEAAEKPSKPTTGTTLKLPRGRVGGNGGSGGGGGGNSTKTEKDQTFNELMADMPAL